MIRDIASGSGCDTAIMGKALRLNELKKGEPACVTAIASDDAELVAKLREVGFAEGDNVEIAHYGPVARKPLCIRLNQTLIALRPEEARAILVAPVS